MRHYLSIDFNFVKRFGILKCHEEITPFISRRSSSDLEQCAVTPCDVRAFSVFIPIGRVAYEGSYPGPTTVSNINVLVGSPSVGFAFESPQRICLHYSRIL
jgi:hypothetical protein